MENWLSDSNVKWVLTLIFSVGVQWGLLRGFKKFVIKQFEMYDETIQELKKADLSTQKDTSDLRRDFYQMDKSFTEVKTTLTILIDSMKEWKSDIKTAINDLRKTLDNDSN